MDGTGPTTLVSEKVLPDLVRPGWVHRSVYTNPEIFRLEMERLFGRAWIYVAHESQIPNPGDFFRTRMGAAEVLVTRGPDGGIHILKNACAHRGAQLCAQDSGNADRFFCPYHAWGFKNDGKLARVPHPQSYPDGFKVGDPRLDLKSAPRVASYRGFVFGSWAADGPDLEAALGPMTRAIDNLVDRAPGGEIEVAGGRFRLVYNGNWKFHHENANDTVHPSFVHESSVSTAKDRDERPTMDNGQTRAMMSANAFSVREWDGIDLHGFENGHSYMGGFYRNGLLAPTTDDPVANEYRAAMEKAYGRDRAAGILGLDRFNNLVYPNLSINAQYHQIRVVHPLAVNRTEVHGYCFRLKGAPDGIFHRSIRFLSTLGSPASMIFADDVAIFERVQHGLEQGGIEWVNVERGLGLDSIDPDCATGHMSPSASELPIRAQMAAWRAYMSDGAA